jgi:predicted AAA+ superfamily ATPase
MIYGAREVGKTTLLSQWINRHAHDIHIFPQIIHVIDASDYQFEDPMTLWRFLQSQSSDITHDSIILLNEIQYSKNILSHCIKLTSIYPQLRLIMTSSGYQFGDEDAPWSHEITTLELRPLDFLEYCAYYTHSQYTSHQLREQYMRRGWFPRVMSQHMDREKQEAIQGIIKKYIDTDARFWFSGDFLITCSKALMPLHLMTDQLLKPITLAKQLKLSPYQCKKILEFFLQTNCFITIPCYIDTYDQINTLHGHDIMYSCDLGLLQQYIPLAVSTKLYYKTYIIQQLMRYQDRYTISSYRKRNGTQLDFVMTYQWRHTIVLCEQKSSHHIPKRLSTVASHLLDQTDRVLICNPQYQGEQQLGQIAVHHVPYADFPHHFAAILASSSSL